ncbi:hypothetical protein MKZ38_008151 [Zalerion maritima]|uniref:Mediator of RNA polymerase II transcription subunit 21 n=1 Tax=Zalerion maritima TaxID=339359 RepID=A0AAD5RV51_9PEZI|nr:hypothetical protein MKZ38_008151 [Zalerion maritima]
MGDRLTQLQEAVDELAQQFAACIHYIISHHDLEKLDSSDEIREVKDPIQASIVDPHSAESFQNNLKELAQDLIMREQQIEMLISVLPGLENSEEDQNKAIRELEEELKVAEQQRTDAIGEKKEVLQKLDEVIRSVRRPR